MALKRLDPASSSSASKDWKLYLDESSFTNYEGILNLNAIGTQYPYLAILPHESAMLDQLRSRYDQFKYDWSNIHQIKLNELIGQANLLLGLSSKTNLSKLDSLENVAEDQHLIELRDLLAHISKQIKNVESRTDRLDLCFEQVCPLALSFENDLEQIKIKISTLENKFKQFEQYQNEPAEDVEENRIQINLIKVWNKNICNLFLF